MKLRTYLDRFESVIWIQVIGNGLAAFVNSLLLPFLTLYIYQNVHQNIVVTTLVIGMQPFTEMLLTLVAGGWTDRWGRRPLMIVSLIIQILAMGGLFFVSSLWVIGFLTMINGFGRFLYIPAARAQVADVTPEDRRSEVFALLATAESIGGLVGPVSGALVFHANPSLIFLMASLSLLLYLVLVVRGVPESKPRSITQENNISKKRPVFYWRNHRLLWLLMFGTLPISFFHSQMETNWPVFLKAHFVNYLVIFSTLETVGSLCFIFLEVWVVRRTEHYRTSRIVGASYVLYAIAAIGLALSRNLYLLLACEMLLCLAAMGSLNHLQKIISILAPVDNRGQYFALYGMNWDISRAIGPFVGGWLMTHIGGSGLFMTCALLLTVGGFTQMRTLKKLDEAGGLT